MHRLPIDSINHCLAEYGRSVAGSGIRYGSVLYLGLGNSKRKKVTDKLETTVYHIEVELGADEWVLMGPDGEIMNSAFADTKSARKILSDLLVGKNILDIELDNVESRIVLDHGLSIISKIDSEPASGFLYSFYVEGGPSWETIDGISISSATDSR